MRALIFSSCIILIIANSLAEAAVAPIPQKELTPNDVEDPNMHLFKKGPFDGGNGLRGPRKGRRDIDVIPQSELKTRDVTVPVAQKYRTRELPGGGTGRGPRKGDMWSEIDQEARTAVERALHDNIPYSDRDTKTIWEEVIDRVMP